MSQPVLTPGVQFATISDDTLRIIQTQRTMAERGAGGNKTMYNHQLDTFIKVCERGSFTKAASELFISPTAVIKQMNSLETDIGVELFNRSHRGLTLTRAGQSLLDDARRIIRLSEEAMERARRAHCAERQAVRVGTSPMTPSTFLTDLWAGDALDGSGISIKVVPFENTPENARHILANLGEEIDIVAGGFDDAYLQSRGCDVLPLTREPLRISVPAGHPLAARNALTLDDLRGRTVLIVQRGWNEETDRLNDFLRALDDAPMVEEFPFLCVDVFNRCEEEGALLVSIDPWSNVHPLLVTKPVAWDFSLPFGILHSPNPTAHVTALLDALKAVNAREESKGPISQPMRPAPRYKCTSRNAGACPNERMR